jgi:hypothetical protein
VYPDSLSSEVPLGSKRLCISTTSHLVHVKYEKCIFMLLP